MTEEKRSESRDLVSQLARYGWAVGTGTLVSQTALADGIDFTPAGGLPIVIDTSITVADPVEIDLDGDAVDDFQLFSTTNYGGGFVIRSVTRVDGVGNPRVQINFGPCCGVFRASRHDRTEYIRPDDNTNFYRTFNVVTGFPDTHIDANGGAISAYTPFRDNPGFIGLALGRTAVNHGYAGTLKVVVNSAGTQLTILGGSYRQDSFDLHLDDGIMFNDGFESPGQSDYFPPAGLKSLALGARN